MLRLHQHPITSTLIVIASLFNVSIAQTVAIDRLQEALKLEQSNQLDEAGKIYQSLATDREWATAAILGLARVQRWQYLFAESQKNYQRVLDSELSTQSMRDEALLGMAQIDLSELRLSSAQRKLDSLAGSSLLAPQVRELRARIGGTYPTRLAINVGKVTQVGASQEDTWQLQLSHQLDMKNTISVSSTHNAFQQRILQPDVPLDFVKTQYLLSWRNQLPAGVAYSIEASQKQMNLGVKENTLRVQGSWPLDSIWRTNVGLENTHSPVFYSKGGFLGISRTVQKNWQIGATMFKAQTSTVSSQSAMLNVTWETNTWLVQGFLSQPTDHGAALSHTVILRQKLESGATWRAQLRHDAAGHQFMLGLDIPWGRHYSTSSMQTSPQTQIWRVGFDYALAKD